MAQQFLEEAQSSSECVDEGDEQRDPNSEQNDDIVDEIRPHNSDGGLATLVRP